MKTHPRREFLLRVLAACGTPLAASIEAASVKVPPQAEKRIDAGSRAAASYFGAGVDAARAVGEAYLRQLNVEPTRASILQHAADTLEILAKAPSQKAALSALVTAVRRDFAEGRVLVLEGWVLSRTEVELCALTVLPAAI